MTERLENCLSCKFLGDRLFGQDIDALFAYQTPKIVKIQDRTLGLMKICLMISIFFYVFIFSIWFKGVHFALSPVDGIARLQWQEPTKDFCNPMDIGCEADHEQLDTLPYCSQNPGANQSLPIKECDYFDARELPISLPAGVLIPTFINKYQQVRACEVGAKVCPIKYKFADANGSPQVGTGPAVPSSSDYVAGVDDFTVLIDHSFRTLNGAIAWDDYNMTGYWKQCNEKEEDCTTRPIQCVHEKCEEMGFNTEAEGDSLLALGRGLRKSHGLAAGAARASARGAHREGASLRVGMDNFAAEAKADNVKAIGNGDVVSLKTILAMAGRSLDEVWMSEEADSSSGETDLYSVRFRGTAIVVNIHYDNMVPWTLYSPKDPPSYTISVSSRPVHKFKQIFVEHETPTSRELRIAYGVYIMIKQTGEIGVFDPIHALITLTSAMALLAMSNMLTDMLAMYLMPKKQVYKELKFQESEDLVTANPGAAQK